MKRCSPKQGLNSYFMFWVHFCNVWRMSYDLRSTEAKGAITNKGSACIKRWITLGTRIKGQRRNFYSIKVIIQFPMITKNKGFLRNQTCNIYYLRKTHMAHHLTWPQI